MVVHRDEDDYGEETLQHFLEALFGRRLMIYDVLQRRRFDEMWAIRNSEFNQDKIMGRNFYFQISHWLQQYQTPGDYFTDYLRTAHTEYRTQRKEIKSNTDSLPHRLMVLLLLDVIGLFNYDTEILRRRLYRQLNPRPAVDWRARLFVFALFLLMNALLMFFTWKHLHDFPRDRLYRWYGSLLTALIVDFAMVETTDVWWSNFLVPSQCKEVWRQGVETVLSIVEQVHEVYSSKQQVNRGSELERYEERKVTSPGYNINSLNAHQIDNDTVQQLRFDMTKYLYVSKQVAKLFPSLVESQIILKYMCEVPGRVLTGPWRDNLDIIYARDGLFDSWKTNIRKYWREGGYKKDVRETIKWMGTLPMAVQRLIVGGWVVASMFALWYFLRGWIAWSGIWWFGVAVCLFSFCFFMFQIIFQQIPYFRSAWEAIEFGNFSLGRCFGVQPGVAPYPLGDVSRPSTLIDEVAVVKPNVVSVIRVSPARGIFDLSDDEMVDSSNSDESDDESGGRISMYDLSDSSISDSDSGSIDN
jgi:hypothetical protein